MWDASARQTFLRHQTLFPSPAMCHLCIARQMQYGMVPSIGWAGWVETAGLNFAKITVSDISVIFLPSKTPRLIERHFACLTGNTVALWPHSDEAVGSIPTQGCAVWMPPDVALTSGATVSSNCPKTTTRSDTLSDSPWLNHSRKRLRLILWKFSVHRF